MNSSLHRTAESPRSAPGFSRALLSLASASFLMLPWGAAGAGGPVQLVVQEAPLTVLGREVAVVAIRQPDGTAGYFPERGGGFDVEVVNRLRVPTAIHWHGLILPNLMDGVPYVTQDPIAPGASMRYQFPLKQGGTYWMHSHFGLQEQFQASAPLILWTTDEHAAATRQHVVSLTDFSFKKPGEILRGLKAGMKMPAMKTADGKPAAMPKMGDGPPVELKAQIWNEATRSFSAGRVRRPMPDIDVRYDALLANFRTLDDPQVLPVSAGESVLLRFIAMSSSTGFLVDTSPLDAELVAVDGKPVAPLRGTVFQLATAQRMDLRVTIPPGGGAFPVLAQGEGTQQLCGVVLATSGASVPRFTEAQRTAPLPAAALDFTQERRLRARNPLPVRPADRVLPAVLGGNMMRYVWTINGKPYPHRDALTVRSGERVHIAITNSTGMGHPMHLHGHDFQVVALDGQAVEGALRDTVLVPAGSGVRIAFDADNPGVWAFHCHLLYHLATGMFTVVSYEGADTRHWAPEKAASELLGLRAE
ncbi:MAG: multicopper oxidase domain-containing protein [Verrucomicrobia bacterium]|nr:multicopper oxidase domain-containing protein [Verrucomicrobiota bacterium]